MHVRCLPLVLFIISSLSICAQQPIGIFPRFSDIGKPKLSGTANYDAAEQVYSLSGAGYNIWFNRDEFSYLYDTLDSDFILTANFEFEGKGVDPHRKVGWMVRSSEDESAAHVSATLHGDGLTVMQWRELRGAYMRDPEDEIFSPKRNYTILQLERSGDTYIMRAAHPGEPLQTIGMHTSTALSGKVLAGLFVCAHNAEVIEKARIWNVRIDRPVPDDYNPGRNGYLGCRLEWIDVFNDKRKVIYEKDDRFEAPNWMPDGKRLLFNMDGGIYTIPVEGGTPEKIDTDFADRNNNDHGISFDGKLLAISHHRSGMKEGGSSIYVLPLKGGKPKLVTEETPSYWHGWAPNNKEVVYVAKREGYASYNIYRAAIADGKETQLTFNNDSHVDGPEYSPDGKYIYYNGNQSGTMQIWRMKPDGSEKEQMTFDQYNNWFPHISPDGKWIVYIAFPEDIPVDSHPSYKRVSLKLMPANGGSARVIAYIYGGQGTINVPSWSPDSRRVAFVSNK